ncbi:thiazolinyl imide reductase [Solihabitans fulvus]|uniref:Thiazolinyl imide reductase n=1 Tax=Solihabitans fulvus TaxID=1892852 RepID=A0A5B2XS90_9PSEU|nr:Gfo/Idh/MocA family oxidoreductase [Solihabitans fulvus]KAA2265802.1 thiazolinyl imide reductase [Solihabitans fulvus]
MSAPDQHGEQWRPRVVVCGTGFGRTYLAATRQPSAPVELVGILARGSARSRDCARHYEVPLYTDVDQLPDGVDIACVVVSAAINGGRGAELAQRLMARGIHVLQEHPLHQAELAECLRHARRHRVVYHLNTHYVHLEPVARFVEAARRLLAGQPALFVDALTCFQVLYTLVDILGSALGGVSPWEFAAAPDAGAAEVLRSVNGRIAGVPVTLRVQNQLNPVERDNGGHVMHRVTLAAEGGNLLLANAHGPVLWTPRLHMPADYAGAVTVDACAAPDLDVPGVRCLAPPDGASYREVVRDQWPAAAGRALAGLRRAILVGEDPLPRGQYHLALCRLVAEITTALGQPEIDAPPAPDILLADELVAGQPPNSQAKASAR